MKYLLLLVLLYYSINSFAQDPNPDLFQTWHLYYVQSTDLSPEFIVSEIEPSINPTLTIQENLDFNGEGACNLFNGAFISVASGLILETTEFLDETNDCGITIHNDFENSYFTFLEFAQNEYEITSETNGMILNMTNSLQGRAIFKNFELSTNDIELKQIQVYPNPSSTILFIESQNTNVKKIELYNSNGLLVKTINENIESIQVSDLSSGIYLMKIFTEFGTLIKKIIKK